MTAVENLLQFILPSLAVSIAVILLCFYHFAKKRRGSYHVTALPERGTEMLVFVNRAPPGYSTADAPPPYSPFDPKLTAVWPGGAPPPYEMCSALTMAPHLWTRDSH